MSTLQAQKCLFIWDSAVLSNLLYQPHLCNFARLSTPLSD